MQQTHISSPRHSQWGLINSKKAKQYQELLQQQQQKDRLKKQTFKKQLDDQLTHKHNHKNQQRETDRNYYNYIVNTTKQMEQKEYNQRLNKFQEMKKINEQNMTVIQEHRNNKNNYEPTPNFNIGFKGQMERKSKEKFLKQKFTHDLDEQVKKKHEQDNLNRKREKDDFYKSLQEQDNFARSQQMYKKNFKQDERVYNYFSKILEKEQQEKQRIEEAMVDKPFAQRLSQMSLIEQNNLKKQREHQKEMRDALDQQVRMHRVQSKADRYENPEAVNYSSFDSVFQSKRKSYDKMEYNRYLRRQMDSQRKNRNKLDFMNEREYLLNAKDIIEGVERKSERVTDTKAQQYESNSKQSEANRSHNVEIRKISSRQEYSDRQVVKSNLLGLLSHSNHHQSSRNNQSNLF